MPLRDLASVRTSRAKARQVPRAKQSTNQSPWFHTHVHSEFSCLDGMSKVDRLVAKAAANGQPAIGLTDHGNMAGTVQLYEAAKQHGILPFPGFEGYLVESMADATDKTPRYHIGLLALNLNGYQGLVKLTSLSHTRPRFSRFPRFDLSDLAELSEDYGDDIALLTGCYFGYVQQTLLASPKQAARIVQTYASWYPNTFVEIQNHNIDHGNGVTDATLCDELVAIADKLGLPVMATQDAHYCDIGEKKAHALMKRVVYGGADDEFPGDAFHFAQTGWVEDHHDPKHWMKAEEGAQQLLDLHQLSLPALDKFTFHVPQVSKDPQSDIETACRRALAAHDCKGLRLVYNKRLEAELEVIEHLGFADYFLILMKIVNFMQDKKVCFEARGSANNSLVCYLLGITQIDPIKWKLLFERFLSKDRKKPPDIDMDVEDERRQEVMDYIAKHFPIVQIGTFGNLGLTKHYGGEVERRGSVLVTYLSGVRREYETRLGKERGSEAFKRDYGQVETIDDVKRVSPSDYPALVKLAGMEVKKSYGAHAAGLLLSADSQPISAYVPTMLIASSDTIVTQFVMGDVEKLGYLKLDLLGQRTLSMMRRAQELIGVKDPTDFSWIPEDDAATCRELRSGRTDGIFQFDGYAMAQGGRAMGIRSTMDCVIANALFRPALMDVGLDEIYIARRKNPDLRKKVSYAHKVFERHLAETYGIVLFQEQVLSIMRELGMPFEGINTILSVVKDSGIGATERNAERFASVRAEFNALCRRNGIKDVDAAWSYIEGYVKYGFNRGHSTGYGLRAYRCAYLKTHYPMEFMAAVLESVANTSSGADKEKRYMREARRIGIRLLPPDVNVSGYTWTLDHNRKAIRKGLMSVKGVGYGAAEAIVSSRPEGGYSSIYELIELTDARAVTGGKKYTVEGEFNGVLLRLQQAGALASLGFEREL